MHSELYHLGEKAECNDYHMCGGEVDGLRKHTTRILRWQQFFFPKKIFIWLHWVSVATHGI